MACGIIGKDEKLNKYQQNKPRNLLGKATTHLFSTHLQDNTRNNNNSKDGWLVGRRERKGGITLPKEDRGSQQTYFFCYTKDKEVST